MTRRASLALVVLPLCVMGPLLVGGTETPPQTSVSRGASLGLFASDPSFDYGDMLDEMRDRGAGDVMIVDRWMQSDVSEDDLTRTARVATVTRTIRQARARGMRVSLMPIVGIRVTRASTEWRGALRPRRGADVWFARYRALLLESARIAQREGVARLIIGSELNWLEHREDLFRSLAQEVRGVFGGELSYSANWDRYRSVPFWDAVDTISVSAYFALPTAGAPTRTEARDAWSRRLSELESFARAHQRPLLLSEVGYPAHAEAAAFPWDETRDAPMDQPLQATLLGAFCDARASAPNTGYFVWNWFGRGGPRDRGYTLRGKPAAAEFERCMHTETGAR